MKFWLSCFFILFVIAELFEWVARLGGVQLPNAWLILGGMGLAAVSNAAHFPKLSRSGDAEAIAQDQPAKNQSEAVQPKPAQPLPVLEQSQEDSISFRVRLPWR